MAWFGLYKFIYKQSLSPGLPGEGIFKYVVWRDPVTQLGRRQAGTCSRNRSSENKWSSKVCIILQTTHSFLAFLTRLTFSILRTMFLASWGCLSTVSTPRTTRRRS